jgi:formate hydrogenlyase subunit 3/multisubunit Na+/H+ antiporter MnhD subunit
VRDQSDVERIFAYSLISAGGAVVIGGLIGVILNQPRLQLEPSHAQPVVAVISRGALFSARWEF